jgi:hypothetical protein
MLETQYYCPITSLYLFLSYPMQKNVLNWHKLNQMPSGEHLSGYERRLIYDYVQQGKPNSVELLLNELNKQGKGKRVTERRLRLIIRSLRQGSAEDAYDYLVGPLSRGGCKKKFSEVDEITLRDVARGVKKKPRLYQLQEALAAIHGEDYKPPCASSIRQSLKKSKVTCKKATLISIRRDPIERARHLRFMQPFEEDLIIAIDETSGAREKFFQATVCEDIIICMSILTICVS